MRHMYVRSRFIAKLWFFFRFLTVQAVGGVGAATRLLLLLFTVAPLFEALTRHFTRDETVEEGWVVAQEVGDRFRCETCAQDIINM